MSLRGMNTVLKQQVLDNARSLYHLGQCIHGTLPHHSVLKVSFDDFYPTTVEYYGGTYYRLRDDHPSEWRLMT